MNSRLRQLLDQGIIAPGDHVRYVDRAGDAVYEATLDRHGDIICYGHPQHQRLLGVSTMHDPCGSAVLVFSSASHFVRHCARLDSRPNRRHYGSLYVDGVAWPNLFQAAPDDGHHSRQPSQDAGVVHHGDEQEDQESAGLLAGEPTAKRNTAADPTTHSTTLITTNAAATTGHHHPYEPEEEGEEDEECRGFRAAASTSAMIPHVLRARGTTPTATYGDASLSDRRCSPAGGGGRGFQEKESHYGELLHLLHALRYMADKGAAPLVNHLIIARFSDLMKMEC